MKKSQLATLELQVLRTIRKFAMIESGEHVLIAGSGGADSTALLLCLHDLAPLLNLKLTVAHLNHRIRGAEADEDEEFVRRWSADLGYYFLSESADVKALAAASKQNLEEAAREARYEFLRRAAARAGADKIATGHNLNDQAETILLRLLRGSGPAGLEGIRPVIDRRLIRPLLECSRDQILKFLSERKATYREDSTNSDLRYQRNRIRHELLPYLEKHFNPRLVTTLAREAAVMSAAWDFLEQQAHLEFEALRIAVGDGIALPTHDLMKLHPAVRGQVVRHALRELLGSLRGIEAVHIENVLRLCESKRSGRRVELPGCVLAQRNLGRLELQKGSGPAGVRFRYELAWPGSCYVPEAALEFVASLQEASDSPVRPSENTLHCAVLNPDAIPATLTIRSRLPGDRYGGQGHRKVKKMFLAARIPLPARAALPIVAAGEAVIWVPGFRPAKTFRAQPASGRSVLIEVKPK
jgi:tRNA(Ile)-lysidine synthase